jgi:hypothetical protein
MPFVLSIIQSAQAGDVKGSKYLFLEEYEDFFTYLLTEKKSCGMIVEAWIRPAVGMQMQRRRLPLGLLSAKPRLIPVCQAIISSREEGRRRFRGKRISPVSQMW